MPVPDALDWPAAGGFPEVFTTAHDALFTQAGLRAGERLLVHGARRRRRHGGGPARPRGRRAGDRDGAQRALPRRRSPRSAPTRSRPRASPSTARSTSSSSWSARRTWPRTSTRSRPAGGSCVIGVGAGAKAEINLRALMGKRGRIHGSTLRARPLEEKAIAARAVERHVLPLFERGALRVPVAETFPLDEAPAAYERFAAGGKLGKIVLDDRTRRSPTRSPRTAARHIRLPEVLDASSAAGLAVVEARPSDERRRRQLTAAPSRRSRGRSAAA